MPNVQKRRWLVQDQDLRLLAQGAGQQDPLALAVADGGEGAVGQVRSPDLGQGLVYLCPIGLGEDPHAPGVGIPPRRRHVAAGHQLRLVALGH